MEETRVRKCDLKTPELWANGDPWTEADNQLLRQCALMNLSRKESAARMGRTYETVRKQASQLGLRFQRDSVSGFSTPYQRTNREDREEMDARSRKLIAAVARAIYRGEHLPGASNASAS